MINLQKVNDFNLFDVLNLKVKKSQESFVATNQESILDHVKDLTYGNISYPLAIFDDDKLIGFTLITYIKKLKDEPNCYLNHFVINRFMIDETYQSKGLGKASLIAIIDFIKSKDLAKDKIYLSYEEDNIIAKKLYKDLGFIETTLKDDNEIIAYLTI